MTEHDLKEMKNLGAELGAAKAEVERLRGLLTKALEFTEANTCGGPDVAQLIAEMRVALYRQADHVRDAAQMMGPSEIIKAIAWGDRDDAAEAIGSLRCLLADPEGEDEIAFPDSPEPTDTYTAVDMATAAAQGFRDGQAAVEQAAVQDELWAVHAQGPDELYAAFSREDAEQHAAALNALPMPAGIQVSAVVIASPWSAAEHWKYLAEQEREHAAELKARAAQTEQATVKECLTVQPMAYAVFAANGNVVCFSTRRDHPSLVALESDGHSVVSLAPIAQTAPQGKFRMGDLVKKSTGSEWVGRVVGWYSTEQTPEGYAVESSAHRNSVQIYPVTALEAVE